MNNKNTVSKFFLGVVCVLLTGQAAAELISQAQWNVLDTDTGLEWRATQGLLQAGQIQPGELVGDYSDVLSRYDTDSTYRLPTAAEVDDLFGKLFPGYVPNDADGLCSETAVGVDGYPGQIEQVDTFRQLFGYIDFHALYEVADGGLRALRVRNPSFTTVIRTVCPTGPWSDSSYAKYRNDPPYPSTLLQILVVRDAIDRKASPLTVFSYLAPEEVGLSAETLVQGQSYYPGGVGTWEATDNGWSSQWTWPDYTGQSYATEFRFATSPVAYAEGRAAPWVRVTRLDYTGPCNPGDTDIGGNWCRRSMPDADYLFTGEPAVFPGTYVNNQGQVDNLVIEQIHSNITVDFDPSSGANAIRPKQAGWTFLVEIETTSLVAGESADFDAGTIDPASLRAGPGLAPVLQFQGTDFDGDGDTDYTFKFQTGASGVSCLDSTLTVVGRTYSGEPLAGSDVIVPVGCEETVDIDVDPFNPVNTVRPDDDYNITVAVLGMRTAAGDTVDLFPGATSADGVDAASLRLGPAATPGLGTPIVTDIDGDSHDDMLVNFNVFDAGIACTDTELELTGNKNSGIPIEGFDAIVTEDCSTATCHP